jgi:hypothetical protein
MPANRESLLAGRNQQPLSDNDVRRAINTFIGFEQKAPVRYDPAVRTGFRVELQNNEETVEIVFGLDLYPGQGVADPNSSLSMEGAVAHELTHWHRWTDKTELTDANLYEIDEALTSLEAAIRYPELSDHSVRQLIADAIQRLQIFAQRLSAEQINDA